MSNLWSNKLNDSATPKQIGRYEDLCETLLRHTDAVACIVIVTDGNKGSGMSFSMRDGADRRALLLNHADQMEFIAAEMRRRAGTILVN